MKKKTWVPMLVCIFLLVVLSGLYVSLKKYNEKEAEKESESAGIKVLDWSSEDVVSVCFNLDGEEETFVLSEEQWKLQGNEEFNVEETKIQSLLSKVTEMTAARKIADVENLGEYGLEHPVQTLVLTNKDGNIYTICWGNSNDTTGDDYIYVKEEPDKVYTVDSSILSSLTGTLEDYEKMEEDAEDTESTEDVGDAENTESIEDAENLEDTESTEE